MRISDLLRTLRKQADRNPDKVRSGLDRAGAFAKKRTGGKHDSTIDGLRAKAERALGSDQPARRT